MKPNVSIVIPARNEAEYLPLSLSALAKTIKNYHGAVEIILVDNGSTDRTKEIAKAYGCKIIDDDSSTISGLRNKGANDATGEYLGFLDADCVVAETWLTVCVQCLQSLEVGIVGTRTIPDFSSATWVEDGWFRLISGVERPDQPIWISTQNMLMRRSIFWEAEGFNESLKTAEDVNFCRNIHNNYLIILEKSINTTHLRESKTICQLIRREIWRGKYSLREASASGSWLTDWQQHSFFLTNFVCLIGMASGIILQSWIFALFMLLNILLPLILIAKKKATIRSLAQFVHVFAVGYFYILARTAALVVELCEMLSQCLKFRQK
jgi:cellulose synthase/poly-beta-1,6-N-acetylglucosamine synthase-like glycosyltransferase